MVGARNLGVAAVHGVVATQAVTRLDCMSNFMELLVKVPPCLSDKVTGQRAHDTWYTTLVVSLSEIWSLGLTSISFSIM